MATMPGLIQVQIDPDALQKQVEEAVQSTKSVWANDLVAMAELLDPGIKDRLLRQWAPTLFEQEDEKVES